jgi:hypothetical protein
MWEQYSFYINAPTCVKRPKKTKRKNAARGALEKSQKSYYSEKCQQRKKDVYRMQNHIQIDMNCVEPN